VVLDPALRPEQWLIWDEPNCQALIRVLETEALDALGSALMKWAEAGMAPHGSNSKDAMTFLGAMLSRLAGTRRRFMQGGYTDQPTPELQHYQSLWATVAMHIAKPGSVPEQAIVNALDELYATGVYLDDKMKGAGVSGNGWFRKLARGD